MKDLIVAFFAFVGVLACLFLLAFAATLAARDLAAVARRRGSAPREPADNLGPLCEDPDGWAAGEQDSRPCARCTAAQVGDDTLAMLAQPDLDSELAGLLGWQRCPNGCAPGQCGYGCSRSGGGQLK